MKFELVKMATSLSEVDKFGGGGQYCNLTTRAVVQLELIVTGNLQVYGSSLFSSTCYETKKE